jgi:hypothetical protein
MITTEQIDSYFKKDGDLNIFDTNVNYLVYNAATAVNKLGYWDLIKHLDPNNGFMFSGNNKIHEIHKELQSDGHSGATFALTLRTLQKIANDNIKDSNNELCVICSSECSNDKTILDCGHAYHTSCIKEWYNSSCIEKSCPLCRKETIPKYYKQNVFFSVHSITER